MSLPLTLSVLALVFTLFSFWWINLRPGSLIVGRPRSWASFRSTDGGLHMISVPVVLYNRGALPVIVQNLRLHIRETDGRMSEFTFNGTRERLSLQGDSSLATQFPVRGREAVRLICDFADRPSKFRFSAGKYPTRLEAVLGNGSDWRALAEFELVVRDTVVDPLNGQSFIAIDNWA